MAKPKKEKQIMSPTHRLWEHFCFRLLWQYEPHKQIHSEVGETYHIQKVLLRLGFSDADIYDSLVFLEKLVFDPLRVVIKNNSIMYDDFPDMLKIDLRQSA